MKGNMINICGHKVPLKVFVPVLSFAVALLFEIFFFNRAHFRILGEPITNPKIYLDDGTELLYDEYYALEDGATLTVPDINQNIKNYYLDIDDYSKDEWKSGDHERLCAFHIRTSLTDEGNACFTTYSELLVSPEINSSMYIPVEPYGKVKDLRITISEGADEFCLEGLCLNARPPIRIDVIRLFILVCLIYFIQIMLRLNYECRSEIVDKRKRMIALLAAAIFLSFLATSIQKQNLMHGMQKGYPDLARSFAEGRVYIEESTDEVLLNMDNPYDPGLRDELGADYYWDVAFFNGKYYIYFGVVPAILFHLPCYLLTGHDLYYNYAQMIMNILIIFGALALIEEVRKKYCRELPICLEVMIYITFIFVIGLGILVKRSAIYYEAIGTAIMLVLWGIFLWLRATQNDKVCLWQGMLGSFFMAAAVGSRPQFAIMSFAGIYFFRHCLRKKEIKTLAALILPYIPVAILLMIYNYVRFGSAFDFGANYNLTTHDMTHIGIHLSRIPMGIWYYLLKTPIFDYTFPYMRNDGIGETYQGLIAWEGQAGGAIALTPYLFLGIKGLKEKSDEGILTRFSLAAVLLVVIADTLMCGISMRYQLDFRFILALPVIIFNMKKMSVLCKAGDGVGLNKYYHLTSWLCFITITLGILTFLCQYEVIDYSYIGTNPVFYCWLRDFFSGAFY